MTAELKSHLGKARSAIGRAGRDGTDPTPHRARVQLAKTGLGERGTPWWEQTEDERRRRWSDALGALQDEG